MKKYVHQYVLALKGVQKHGTHTFHSIKFANNHNHVESDKCRVRNAKKMSRPKWRISTILLIFY